MHERIREIVKQVLDGMNLKLVNVEYKDAGPRSVLRIFIDKPGGVTIDDCVEASKVLNVRLDVENLIPHRYTLEVSSPGLTRRLATRQDFEDSVGRHVKIITKTGCFVGKLVDFKEGVVELVAGESRNRVRFDEIERANLELDPDVWVKDGKKTGGTKR